MTMQDNAGVAVGDIKARAETHLSQALTGKKICVTVRRGCHLPYSYFAVAGVTYRSLHLQN